MPTHGSLTKAGKVRAQTPKIDGIPKKNVAPKKRNKSNFSKRIANVQEDRFGGRRSKGRR